jgi:hypothetical protein
MPNTNFYQDVANPAAGIHSDLYKTIEPMLPSSESTNTEDTDRIAKLKDQVRQGLVGAQYLTGLKQNTGESFYDKHPVQAVLTDVLANSGKIGLGVGGGAALINMLRQKHNMDITQPASMSRKGNIEDVTNAANLLNPVKTTTQRPDVSRLFGSVDTDPIERLKLIDQLGGHDFSKKLKKAKGQPALAKLWQQAHASEGAKELEKYVDFHQSLQAAKQKGGLKKYLGEHLSSLTKPDSLIRKLVDDSQSITDLAERQGMVGPRANKELLRRILAENVDHPDVNSVVAKLTDPKLQGSALSKALNRVKLPLALGAGIPIAGAGLYHLVKALQNKMHSEEKQKEWKKTLLRARGDFDAAERL